jgi:hypothetical protein
MDTYRPVSTFIRPSKDDVHANRISVRTWWPKLGIFGERRLGVLDSTSHEWLVSETIKLTTVASQLVPVAYEYMR